MKNITTDTNKLISFKRFGDALVMTKRDLAAALDMTIHALEGRIYNGKLLTRNVDYFLIEGSQLAKFRAANPEFKNKCSQLLLVNLSGIRKLYKCQKKKLPTTLALSAKADATQQKPARRVTVIMESLVDEIKSRMFIIDVLLDKYFSEEFDDKEQENKLKEALMFTGMEVHYQVGKLVDLKD